MHEKAGHPGYRCDTPDFTEDLSPAGTLAPVLPPQDLFGPYAMSAGIPFSVPDGLAAPLDTLLRITPFALATWLQEQAKTSLE